MRHRASADRICEQNQIAGEKRGDFTPAHDPAFFTLDEC
jgi:hypothetical protein